MRALGTLATVVLGAAACGGSVTRQSPDDARGNDGSSEATDGDGSVADSGSDSTAAADSGPCADGAVTADAASPPASCQPGGDGLTNCGSSSEDCCTSLEVPGGSFYRTYDLSYDDAGGLDIATAAPDGGPTSLTDPATISSFRLDKYLVTVGRFRQFVAAWNEGSGWTPPEGSGKHSYLNCGQGLSAPGTPSGYEPGWSTADNTSIAPTDANLNCSSQYATWTPSPGANETLPINCVVWYEAYAFCIWDGGFLPSEAEADYASAGGDEQRLYPWGSTDPGTSNAYAIYDCLYPPAGNCSSFSSIAPVGTAAAGAGRWGQVDLDGNLDEWSLDYWHSELVIPCTDCTPGDSAPYHSIRGGNFTSSSEPDFVPGYINGYPSAQRAPWQGLRCGRAP
jgi:formylglycine-generating enzyme required for sulfatase activity